jgi:regulator of sigma E protease
MLAQLLLSLSFLVAVHEFGHLLAAKYFGMRVEQFSIGFPPKIFSFKKGETEYALSAIPLGGYVKISGMIDESLDTEKMKLPPQSWEFRAKPAWQRLIVMLGGIVVNVIVGVLIFIGLTYVYGDRYILKDEVNKNGGYHVGPVGESLGLKTGDKIVRINGRDFEYYEDITKPETLLSTNGSYTIERNGRLIEIPITAAFLKKINRKSSNGSFVYPRIEPIIGEIEEGHLAARILKPGDEIVEINGEPVGYWDEVTTKINGIKADSLSGKSDSLLLKISRAGDILMFREYFRDQKSIGCYPDLQPFLAKAEKKIDYGFMESVPRGADRAFSTLAFQVNAFEKVITGALSPVESFSGPIGIMQEFGNEWDWSRFWYITGVLSLVLAFMNLLPIPALDGGHVMFLSYEIISRRKASDKFLENAQKAGMVFLLALMVFVFTNDIIKLF